MRGQILALRAQEGHAKLIVNSIQKLVDSFQRIDPSQTASTLEEFGNSFGSLADTLKDLFSGQRVKDSMAEDQRRRVLAELSTCKNVLEHIRTNTQNISKSASNSSWELRELRTGGPAKDSGEVDAQISWLKGAPPGILPKQHRAKKKVKLMHKRVVFSQPLGFLERTRCLPLLNSWESFQLTLLKIGSWGVVLSCDGIEGVPTRCFFVLFVLTWR